ncbi:hypothetical protein C8J56DRAFT_797132, partial [Mycena floridula]
YGFPATDCEAGFNARLHFPSCASEYWNGVNLDSPNHINPTAYLTGLDNGKCPDTHSSVPLMHIFYEITCNVADFSDRWTEEQGWPFVYAPGDPTGFDAIDKCNNPNNATNDGKTEACKFLTVKSAAESNKCKIPSVVNEGVDGPFAGLPGCFPLQSGPQDATPYSDANCPTDLPF